jgi:hypothetical protein
VKSCKEIAITKQDGSVECFRAAKLTACLTRVLDGRAYDPRLAGPLARAVAMHLEEWTDPRLPTTHYIFRCVCSVLQQTGLNDVAEDLINHRRLRASRRRRIRVIDDKARKGGKPRPWRKLSLVATLQDAFGISHAVARFLAGQVEAQVFALNYRLVTKAFLTELVRNEVLAWGLADGQVLGVADIAAAAPAPDTTQAKRPE